MKKELYIQIPEPCHEDWNKMTPVQQGRYCQSCCKEVVDFSLMNDMEIMNFLSKPRGKTCGNFSTDQLNRVIKEPATPAKKRIWAVMLSFLLPLFISNKSKAQFKPKHTVDTVKIQPDCSRVLLGKIAVRGDTVATVKPSPFEVQGIIEDSSGNPVAAATVIIKGTHIGTAANEKGEFRFLITDRSTATLQISAVGFAIKEIMVTAISNLKIVLKSNQNDLTGVVVVGYSRVRTRGAFSTVSKCTISVKDTAKNLIQPSLIKVYPNPASKSSFVNVQLTNKGEYQLKLVDNQGKLIQQNTFITSSKRQAYHLELPSTIAAGIYYINVFDEKSKKQYTQKLIVQ